VWAISPASSGPASTAADQTMLISAATAATEMPARFAPATPIGNVIVNISAMIGARTSRNATSAAVEAAAAGSTTTAAAISDTTTATSFRAARSPNRAVTALLAMKAAAETPNNRPIDAVDMPF